MKPPPHKILRFAPYALMALPVVLAFLFVAWFGVNVPWLDQTEGEAPLFEKWFTGTLSLGDFWEQHNEHRVLFPRLIMLSLGLLTRWNTVAEMYVVLLCLLAVLVMGAYVVNRECDSPWRMWLMVPLALALFNLRQHQNMLWGFQIGFLLVIALAAGSFLCLHVMRRDRALFPFIAAVALAVACSFSHSQGLAVWPAGLVSVLFCTLTFRRKVAYTMAWTVLGLVSVLLYFHGYVKPPYHPAYTFSPSFYLAAMGGAFCGEAIYAFLIGGLILVLTMIAVSLALYNRVHTVHSFWIALIVFGMLALAAITIGRGSFGTKQALHSRYASYSVLIPVSACAILGVMSLNRYRRWLAFCAWVCVALLTAGGVWASVVNFQQGENTRYHRRLAAFQYCTIDSQPDSALVHPFPGNMRRAAQTTRSYHLSLFAHSNGRAYYNQTLPSLPVDDAQPAWDARVEIAPDKGNVTVRGWALDPRGNQLAAAVYLEIDGKICPTFYGMPLTRVQDPEPGPHKIYCGFVRAFPLATFPPGPHHLKVWVVGHGGKTLLQPSREISFSIR